MKLIALFAAGALAAGTVAAAPADAQSRHGWHGGQRSHDGNRWHGNRNWHRPGRVYRAGYGWRGGYRHSRVVCRIHRGYSHPVRRCVRVYR